MIQDILNAIEPNDVKGITFDMKEHRIHVMLNDKTTISFEEVESFYYTEEEVSINHKNLKPIVFDRTGFDAIFTNQDLEDSVSVPNVSLCVHDRSMLIEANRIRVGDDTYLLKGQQN